MVATATIPEAFYEDWKHTYYRASTSVQNRQRNLDEAAELIERVCNKCQSVKANLCVALNFKLFYGFHVLKSKVVPYVITCVGQLA